jgi:hypothetical protein
VWYDQILTPSLNWALAVVMGGCDLTEKSAGKGNGRMTKHELIDAYIQGRVGRRDFINRLTGMGISAAAAVAYAASFAPAAGASGGQTRNGYKVRFQDATNDEYGTPIGICQALDVLVGVSQRLIDRLSALTSLNRGLRNVLRRLQQRLELLQELQQTYCGTAYRSPAAVGATLLAQGTSSGEKQQRLDLIKYFDTVLGVYTYVVPTVDDAEHRTSLMSLAMALAREAENVRRILGEDASEDEMVRPISPDDAAAILDELDADQTA